MAVYPQARYSLPNSTFELALFSFCISLSQKHTKPVYQHTREGQNRDMVSSTFLTYLYFKIRTAQFSAGPMDTGAHACRTPSLLFYFPSRSGWLSACLSFSLGLLRLSFPPLLRPAISSSCCSSQRNTIDSWKRKKQGSGYMVNPVSNKTITLDQILAVEFLQQEFRRRVAQR